MPHILVTRPEHDRARSLGNLSAAWIEYHCRHGIGDVAYEPYELDDDFYEHLLDAYALDEDGSRLYSVVVLSRPKGTAKSELTGSAVVPFEALGPCRFAGWAKGGEVYTDPDTGFIYEYEPGEAMGRPLRSARIRFMAAVGEQVGESYDNTVLNLSANPDADSDDEQPPLWLGYHNKPDFFAGLSKCVLPGGARITPVATGAKSKDGGKDTLTIGDEVHLYTEPRQVKAIHTLTRNLLKRKKAEGWVYLTTTMHQRGENSLGEQLYHDALAIMAGDEVNTGMLYDHREGHPVEDLDNKEAVEASLREAYADREWINYAGYTRAAGTTAMGGPEEFRRYFLNQEVSAQDAYLASDQVARSHYLDEDTKVPPLAPGDAITMGLDFAPGTKGGRTVKRLPDSTALIACRLSDMSLHILDLQEAPAKAVRDGWAPSIHQLETAIDTAFKLYRVAAFYADPSHIESHLETWARKYGGKVKVRAAQFNPFMYHMTGKATARFSRFIKDMYTDIETGVVHVYEDLRMIRHLLNTRRRDDSRYGLSLGKENDDSPNKIDATVAGIMAYAAARACQDKGITGAEGVKKRGIARRIR